MNIVEELINKLHGEHSTLEAKKLECEANIQELKRKIHQAEEKMIVVKRQIEAARATLDLMEKGL